MTRGDGTGAIGVLPRLHVVTDDEVLGDPGFPDIARAVTLAAGPGAAFHLRGPATTGRRLFELGRDLRGASSDAGARLVVNDRIDVARAVDADGVQLGARSLHRSDLPDDSGFRLGVGASVHGSAEARTAGPVDWLIVGTLWTTPSHPERAGAGIDRIREVLALSRGIPVIGIGGITVDRVEEVLRAGAHGVAVLRGIWNAPDPPAAVAGYLEALRSISSGVA